MPCVSRVRNYAILSERCVFLSMTAILNLLLPVPQNTLRGDPLDSLGCKCQSTSYSALAYFSYYTPWLLVNSRSNQIADNPIADWSTRRLVNSRTSHWTTRGLVNSRTTNLRTGQLAGWSTRGLVNSRTAHWTTRGLVDSRPGQFVNWSFRRLCTALLKSRIRS